MSSESSPFLGQLGKSAQARRKHHRYAYEAPVIYRQFGAANSGSMRNLSEGGVKVELPELFPPGTPLDLLISLGERFVRADAKVVWSQESPHKATTSHPHSLKFTWLEHQDQLKLKFFIAEAFRG